MLVELAVENLGVIESARLAFGPGMTVLTGETGAGKTMVVEAINLLLGEKPDPSRVRPGAREAVVEGLFAVGDEEWVLRRVVPADGRSRAYVSGELSTASRLAELGATLLEVHGQHAQQALTLPRTQRDALDRFAGVDRSPLTEARAQVAAIQRRLDELGGDRGAGVGQRCAVDAGEAVECVSLGPRQGQGLLGVLAVHLEQRGAQLGETGRRRQLTADVGA